MGATDSPRLSIALIVLAAAAVLLAGPAAVRAAPADLTLGPRELPGLRGGRLSAPAARRTLARGLPAGRSVTSGAAQRPAPASSPKASR